MNLPLFLCILYAALIFYLSSKTSDELSSLPTPDYIAHFIEYFGFGILLFWWRSKTTVLNKSFLSPAFWQALLIGAFYGASDEIHQYFVPGRCTSWHDWFADVIGVGVGALVAMYLIRFVRKGNLNI